ncbi:probable indole-3-pyruvate monooxygenase YUCCA9 [Sorghum bicolor]|uniref:probable indole-3-pyruvate monooxygenase YUCCA9 n=1 Tax=Sorghum bicolor TaxID=4558 RepID=UPI000B426383|nr:probable indole-3-pyruvate monooxygenase YUCCA9 [Sorghum bicolor]|eukprot:XP_021320022.1 probable indole-3-pyruvate monooxygenase YUCCA9 [Sorghum bicolor]
MINIFPLLAIEINVTSTGCYWVNGALIIGAGPAGLAVAACLREQGVPSVVLERAGCIAPLWQHRTYARLKLHLPKRFCELPLAPFPPHFPEYPSRSHFLSYLHSYARRFAVAPHFRATVASARRHRGVWRVDAHVASSDDGVGGGGRTRHVQYVCQWLVVATGENAEPFVPDIEGLRRCIVSARARAGAAPVVMHAAEYRSGEHLRGKRVLVVGCGNSGMEVCLDLCHHGASPSMVVRDAVHVLPREVLGRSTFAMSAAMARWLPLWLVDRVLLAMAALALGDVERYGLRRPAVGPLEMKKREGRTPVLDTGAVAKIRSGQIKVVPEVRRFLPGGAGAAVGVAAELVDGSVVEADAVVLATGYRSNVASWLKVQFFFTKAVMPMQGQVNGAEEECRGLYAVGFTGRGLAGIAEEAIRIAGVLGKAWSRQMEIN